MLVCRVWDGVMDLAMGALADRTHTRWGKFRPWILWSAAPLAAFAVTFLLYTLDDQRLAQIEDDLAVRRPRPGQ